MRHLILLTALLLASCTFPIVRLTDEQIAQLKPGMTTEQVLELLGRPLAMVYHALDPNRKTYQYMLSRKPYTSKFAHPAYADQMVTRHQKQHRAIELVFVDGKLVK